MLLSLALFLVVCLFFVFIFKEMSKCYYLIPRYVYICDNVYFTPYSPSKGIPLNTGT